MTDKNFSTVKNWALKYLWVGTYIRTSFFAVSLFCLWRNHIGRRGGEDVCSREKVIFHHKRANLTRVTLNDASEFNVSFIFGTRTASKWHFYAINVTTSFPYFTVSLIFSSFVWLFFLVAAASAKEKQKAKKEGSSRYVCPLKVNDLLICCEKEV